MTSTSVRIFAFEYLSGGGLGGAAMPPNLTREGDIMLRALVADLAELPGVQVWMPRDRRLPDPGLRARVQWLDPAQPPWPQWRAAIEQCDAAWPIAPERGGALARCCALVESAQRRLLGTPSATVQLVASKSRLAAHLRTHGVAVLPTAMLDGAALPASTTGWVVKPDDGAGAEDTYHVPTQAAWAHWREACAPARDYVVQPYLPGPAASLSLVCRDGRMHLLACNAQDVRIEGGRFHYRGSVVGAREDARTRYAQVAACVAAALPGLAGYVGIDLIDGAHGPVVLEVNARLTTSYAGLHAALGCNPAALVLDLLRDGCLPTPALRPRYAIAVGVDSHAA